MEWWRASAWFGALWRRSGRKDAKSDKGSEWGVVHVVPPYVGAGMRVGGARRARVAAGLRKARDIAETISNFSLWGGCAGGALAAQGHGPARSEPGLWMAFQASGGETEVTWPITGP